MNLRQTISAILTVAAGIALASCGGSSGSSGTSTSNHLLYVSTGQGIYGFRIDKSGFGTVLPSAPFIVGNTPAGMVLDASGHQGYVANQSDNTISLVKIDSASGVVSEVLPRVSAGGFSPDQLLLDSGGTTLFSANLLSNSISVFTIGTGGALTLSSNTQLLASPANMAFAGGLLFVAVPNFSRVYVFSLSSGNLVPLTGSPLLVTDGVGTVTVDPSAKFLYVTNPANNTISGYSIQYSSGASSIVLAAIPGSPFAPTTIQVAPTAAILDATSTHLYVTNSGSSNVSLFSVATNGALASLSTVTATVGASPNLLAFDKIGPYLLVGNVGGKSVTELKINSDATLTTNGAAVSVPSVPRALVVTQ